MPHCLISAAHKSSGKTTISIGLCAAFAQRGLKVQPFKKGPDYIDPLWLSRAAGRSCFNLDFYTMSEQAIQQGFGGRVAESDIAIIEGNKGLYDGLDLDGSNSNAALAHLLDAPVILVIDSRGMTRGVAPLILGYQAFDKKIRIGGVILNRLGGSRHEAKLRAVIEHYTDVPVLGAVHVDPKLEIVERHLGLMPSNETDLADAKIADIGSLIADQVDLDAVQLICESAGSIASVAERVPAYTASRPLRIGIAQDDAFGFYYPDDLEALLACGAKLLPFSPLRDSDLPEVDALFIGGGFPETHLSVSEANESMRRQILAAIEADMPVYAECGGLMYLARSIQSDGRTSRMVGALQADVIMEEKPQGRGYARVKPTGEHPWCVGSDDCEHTILAHEFHYSRLQDLGPDVRFAYEVQRGSGVDGHHDGIVYRNVLASYTHLRSVSEFCWAERFMKFVEECTRA